MKELEQIDGKSVQPVARVLKSLLKKPGQNKQRSHKNRVVINEKLNEFFAADYIILIKEECCGDYEEECDCCCQEPEMIRLGNCKECRAELTRQLAGGLPDDIDNRYNNTITTTTTVALTNGRFNDNKNINNHNEVLHCEDDDEEEEYEEEIDDEDEENDEAESSEEIDQRTNGNGNRTVANDLHCNEQLQVESSTPVQQQHQTETLSPPEGYKDVYDDDDTCQTTKGTADLCLGPVVICGECNYYHHRQRTDGDEEIQGNKNELGEVKKSVTDIKPEKNVDETSEDVPQSSPDVQRYVVETITMTTVTERRIVREISEDKGNDIDQVDSPTGKVTNELNIEEINGTDKIVGETSVVEIDTDGDNNKLHNNKLSDESLEKESVDGSSSSDLCIPFKFGNSTLVANSFKPNSAVRQLFPNPRFISPPPTLTKSISVLSNDEAATDSDGSERFLVTTENLRLFDLVKRGKLSGSRSDSSESDSSIIKRSIERSSTLRRNLASKYDNGLKKKNLNNKDVSLEERIRQLTCVDQDEDVPDTNNSVQNDNSIQNQDQLQLISQECLPTRTSPSGEERPVKNERVVRAMNDNIQETNSPSPPLSLYHQHHHHHHHYHHHHSQSAYRKITDLFSQKKLDNMPDLGIGDKNLKSITKMNCDARKQFLSSLAPLSCVTASTGVENHQDYYQLTSKINNRDSTGYNSDSSYSLEDIEAALKGDDKNNKNSSGPPDVTRGTPTGTGSDTSDTTTDELLAFVEQDKTRTERLKRRYDTEDVVEKNGNLIKNEEDDEDDELNDYGFNRRPSVQGIKPQFETTSEIVRQIRYRTLPASIADKTRLLHASSWPYYDDESLDKQKILFNQQQLTDNNIIIDDNNVKIRDNTINRINTMQKQIDDIYQTIAETAVSVQGTIDRNSYLENTLPRNNMNSSSSSPSSLSSTTTTTTVAPVLQPVTIITQQQQQQRLPSTESHHYEQKNGLHFQDHQRIRIPEGYNSLKSNRRGGTTTTAAATTTLAISNYPCGGLIPVENTKCYRTMYLVPYNGITDPTYQNIQRILPPHSSPHSSYANHIERYPYPRNTSQQLQQQQQQMPKYYARTPQTSTINSNVTPSPPPPPPPFHLHLHQPDDTRFNSSAIGMQTLQLQHHQHISQLATYNVQSVPSYTVMAPSRTGGYHYPIHPTRITDIQSQTISMTPGNTNTIGSGFNGISNQQQQLSSANSSTLSSPTKIHQLNSISLERGVPEGAASVPSHDFMSSQSNGNSNSFIGHGNNVPPPNTQNSVYYAMNV